MFLKIFVLMSSLLIMLSSSFADELNIYSYRKPFLLKPFLDEYSKQTKTIQTLTKPSSAIQQRQKPRQHTQSKRPIEIQETVSTSPIQWLNAC